MGDVPCGWQAGKGPTNFLSTAVQMRFICFPGGSLAWAAVGCQASSLVADWWSSPPLLRALSASAHWATRILARNLAGARSAVADVALRGSGVWGGAEERWLELGPCPCPHPFDSRPCKSLRLNWVIAVVLGSEQGQPSVAQATGSFQIEGVGDARCPRLQ